MMFKFPGKRPADLGVHGGALLPCPPDRQNCVCSQQEQDSQHGFGPHHVPPFTFEGNAFDAMTRLLAVLMQREDCAIITQTREYMHCEFETGTLGMVHDVEFLLSLDDNVIHVRSASRVGRYDFGINAARVEELRVQFDSMT